MAIPSVVISLSNYTFTKTQTTATVTFVFSEAVSGFTNGDVVTPNASIGTLTTIDNITFTGTMTVGDGVLDNSNAVTIAAGSYVSVSTAEAGLAGTSANYTINTVSLEITVADVTDGTNSVTGNGAFDVFMQAIEAHLKVEYDNNRINSDQYPQVYLGALNSCLAQAVQFVLQKPIIEKQAVNEDAKRALIERQTKGFDDDAKQKLLKQALDSWAVAYSVAKDANSIPDAIKVNPIDSIMKNAMDALSIVNTNNPLGEA